MTVLRAALLTSWLGLPMAFTLFAAVAARSANPVVAHSLGIPLKPAEQLTTELQRREASAP